MKKAKIKKLIPFLVLIFLAVVLAGCFLIPDRSAEKEKKSSVSVLENLTEESKEEAVKNDTEKTVETKEDTEKNTVSSEKNEVTEKEDPVNDTETAVSQTEDHDSQEMIVNPEKTEETAQEGKEENPYVKFPYKIGQDSLIVQKIQAYSGSYIEDGSNEQVSDIFAILVTNTGEQCVEFADISLTSEKGVLNFSVSALEAGASCVVLETNRTAYEKQNYLECTAETAFLDKMEMSETSVEVTETKSGALTVKNVGKDTIPSLRVFYKYYDEEENVYIGGIAYTFQVTDLEAGFSTMVTPAHYQAGQSKVIMVRTYKSNE